MTKPLQPLNCGLLALCLGLGAPAALASDDCDVPIERWQPREAVARMAAQRGWQVQRLKIDDGCYELRGRDAQGRGFKAKIDPLSLGVVKMKLRERDDDDDNERDRERPRSRGGEAATPATTVPATSPPATSTPASPARPVGPPSAAGSAPGRFGTPRGQIE